MSNEIHLLILNHFFTEGDRIKDQPNHQKVTTKFWGVFTKILRLFFILRTLSSMLKRKAEPSELEGKELVRRKKLEDAKKHIQRTGASIRAAAKLFGIGQESLSIYLQSGFQSIGRPPLLDDNTASTLKLYLSSLDSMNMQQTIRQTGHMIQALSQNPSVPSANSVKKYVKNIGLKVRKARTSDEGRMRVIESIDHFVHYYDLLKENLNFVIHDPHQIFNVDEVGVQLAERSIHLVTGREYLNKNMNQTSSHLTLVLCTTPGDRGIIMRPHFLFQQCDDSEPHLNLSGTLDATCETNKTGYQDEKTWQTWMNLFILWKCKWLVMNGLPCDAPVLLLLDGHYSHLNLEVLYTAARNRVVILCMLAHATHLVQPNDKSFNKTFKQNLDKEFAAMVSNDLVVQNHDLAFLCEKALNHENLKKSILSSYRQVGVLPFDCQIVLRVIRKYQVHLKDKSEQEKLNTLKKYLEEKCSKKKRMSEEQSEQKKASSSSIRFGTTTAKVVNSPTWLARIKLCEEWKETKSLKKKELITKMTKEFGFVEDELQQKLLPELKSMAEKYLLSKEKQLVESFQRNIDEVTVPLPPEITNFLSLPCMPEVVLEVVGEPERDKIENESGILTLENEILTFLEQGLGRHEVDDDETFTLMASMFKRAIAEDNGSLCLQL